MSANNQKATSKQILIDLNQMQATIYFRSQSTKGVPKEEQLNIPLSSLEKTIAEIIQRGLEAR